MAHTPYLTAPLKLSTMPPGIPYIIGNEAAERFSFYGMRAILVVFMTHYLRDSSGVLATMSEAEASTWFHLFLASNYFFPVFGAILADAFLGKYRTIFWLSIVYCGGHLALALDDTRAGLGIGLTLIALGAGGIKPCVSANVGDQFGQSNQHLLSRAFGWFYFSVNFGSFFSILLIPWLLKNYSPNLAFGVPGILMLLATVIFWAGRRKFVHIPPAGKSTLPTNYSREDWAAIGRLAIIFSFVAIFWSLWDQSGGRWVLQGEKMNLHFMGITWLSSQIQAVNAIMVLLFIPLFQYVIYPAINRVFPLNPLRKIGLGIFVSGVSFIMQRLSSSRPAHRRRSSPASAGSCPAYALLTAAEIMVSITALEFAYTQAPQRMKSVIMSLYLLSISAGNLVTAAVNFAISRLNLRLEGANYYLFFTALAMLASIIFVFFARRYTEKSYLQDEASAPAST
jgi:POT family proton-dependent oligopeptide transporter